MNEKRTRHKAMIDRMLAALGEGDEVMLTEDGALGQVHANELPMSRSTSEDTLFEQVHYALDLHISVTSPELESAIVQTIVRLPEAVREYVCVDCLFIEVNLSRVLRGNQRNRWRPLCSNGTKTWDV